VSTRLCTPIRRRRLQASGVADAYALSEYGDEGYEFFVVVPLSKTERVDWTRGELEWDWMQHGGEDENDPGYIVDFFASGIPATADAEVVAEGILLDYKQKMSVNSSIL